ncbi:STYKc [Aspergillus sclerotialis]|uniref:STYKc n=1 Tax=Aspergillus sclerotialis TaxID=2070753 RepID=A0A3A2ZWM3_9EURO|nr:STYKc [Aspergillus sclerotialis]
MTEHFYPYIEEINPLIERFIIKCQAQVPAIGGHSVLLFTPEKIAAKIPFKADDYRLQNEQEIFDQLEKCPSPYIIRCLLSRPNIIFMPLLNAKHLHDRMKENDIHRPILPWMFQLTSAVVALEAIGLAHGDINPLNILIDNNDRLTLIDLDHTLRIGDDLEVGDEPYIRVHTRDGREGGGFLGKAGAEAEQFGLGSIFFYMTRGKELYADMTPYDRVQTLLARQFPDLESDNPIDNIISRCWNGEFARVADILREIENIAAEQGILDSIAGTESFSNVEYIAKRKLCKQYYSLLLEDSESKPVETNIRKYDAISIEKSADLSWKQKAHDVASHFKGGFNYNGSIHLALTVTITITVGAAMFLTSCLRKKL